MKCLVVPAVVLQVCTVVLAASPQTASQPARVSKDWPRQAYDRAVGNVNRQKSQGEQFCWVANSHMGQFVQAYKTWHDTAWLDHGIKFYDYCLGKMRPGPDGYMGWVGRYGDEAGLLAIAERVVAATGASARRPPVTA